MTESDSSPSALGSTTSTPAALFISYASNDAAAAAQVCAALEAAGQRCWLAPRDVRGGEPYAAEIVRAISSCRLLLVVVSRHAAESAHVLSEVERAFSKRRPILAVRLDEVVLPPALEYFLSTNQWLDASGGRLQSALPAVIAAAGGLGPAASGALPAPAPRRRWPTLAGAALSAAALAVGAWLWLSAHRAPSPAPAAAVTPSAVNDLAGTAPRSVGVLPFTDLSEKQDQQYFSDGLTEELIDRLSRVPDLHVPARASSFYFKGRQAQLAEIAAGLHVAHVLEGSVRKAGDEVRVSAELVRVRDGARLWSDTYDRRIKDIFKVQDEIAGAVVKALQGSLLASSVSSAVPTTNPEAYTTYLQGQAIRHDGTAAGYARALSYYQQAVTLDPGFALAWAAIADVISDAYGALPLDSRAAAAARAHAAASRALALNPDLAATQMAAARLAFFVDRDWGGTARTLTRTLELEAGNAEALRMRSYLAAALGQFDDERQFAQQAIAHDPLDYWNYFALCLAGYNGRRFEEGEGACRKALELNERADSLHAVLAQLLVAKGEPQAALVQVRLESNETWRELALPRVLDALGERAAADRALAAAQGRYASTHAYWIAIVYAGRKDLDNAFSWLGRAVDQPGPTMMIHSAELENLRGDARYLPLRQRMKLPP
jgi:TolB-like protein